MRRFLVKKILLIFPSLLLLSCLVFFLSKLAPGDPVDSIAEMRGYATEEFNNSIYSVDYNRVAEEMDLNIPLFYFSVQPNAFPDTFYRIVHPQKRTILKSWMQESAEWKNIQEFIDEGQDLLSYLNTIDSIKRLEGNIEFIRYTLKNIFTSEELEDVQQLVQRMDDSIRTQPLFDHGESEEYLLSFYKTSNNLKNGKNNLFTSFPVVEWNGTNNQYHKWLASALKLDFGKSLVDALDVQDKISIALFWTFLYVIMAYILSLIIAIPLGLLTAWYHNKWIEKLISNLSFIFYAFPLFWLATLAVVFLTSSLYHDLLNIFPSIGLGPINSSMNIWQKSFLAFPHLLLPALILALHSSAQGIRIIRNSTIVELKSDYFITAKAKGLSNIQVLWKHVFPNAMLPIITMLVSGFPAALAGSVVLEVIFNIPGLGRLLYDSIHYMDWNVVFAILLFIGLITFIFYLLGDLLYAYLNPKIKYDNS